MCACVCVRVRSVERFEMPVYSFKILYINPSTMTSISPIDPRNVGYELLRLSQAAWL